MPSLCLLREYDYRFLFIAPVQHRGLADALDYSGGAALSQRCAGSVALGAIADGDFYLYQLVMPQRDIEFVLHGFSHALLANTDNGLQSVAEGFEMFELFFIECHQGRVEYQSWDCADRATGGVYGA